MSLRNVESLFIHATPDHIHLRGDAKQDLRLLAEVPLQSLLTRPTVRSLDFLNIAAGVYAVDRAVKRKPGEGNDLGVRTLGLCFAVDDVAFWQRRKITDAVEGLLHFLTDENWSLRSVPAALPRLSPQRQSKLPLPWVQKPRRIALYSGDLDSAAGLANQVLAGKTDHLLLTVGHHSALRRRCTRQIQQLSEQTGTARQLHANLVVALRGGAAKRMSTQESSQRTRAFLFCAAAAVAAQTCEVEDIEVFENGVGAINLPVMTGMLTGGLATRGAHPTFLARMGDLASAVAEKPVRYSLPFAAHTKAEMLTVLKTHNLGSWAQLSHSCVHTSLRERGIRHCGQCPGCIERRQAFAAAGIPETTRGQYSDKPLTQNNADYLRCYLKDAAGWLADGARVRRRLHWHLAATQLLPEHHTAIAQQLRRHAQEVISTLGHLTVQPGFTVHPPGQGGRSAAPSETPP